MCENYYFKLDAHHYINENSKGVQILSFSYLRNVILTIIVWHWDLKSVSIKTFGVIIGNTNYLSIFNIDSSELNLTNFCSDSNIFGTFYMVWEQLIWKNNQLSI